MDAWEARGNTSPIDRLLYADQKTYLVELLMKQDRMSMACSIESRVPFLDHPFVEFAASVPENLKIRHGVGKYIVKKAAADLISPDILYRKKMGFPTPIRQWLRDGRAKAMLASLLDRNGFIAAYLNLPVIEKLLESHQRGSVDATDRIWRLLNLQLWGDVFLTGRRAGG
jgi:asparagine synthase (glutamine-hydrolysing)